MLVNVSLSSSIQINPWLPLPGLFIKRIRFGLSPSLGVPCPQETPVSFRTVDWGPSLQFSAPL